ncbi:MAG: HAD-IA family hydrolase, partial [Proteobacteria bacterium]|nr:HAD-IA family hydrolase [Pseudomonadota bacterium]
IGTFAIEFAKRGFQSFGVDYDAAALTIARELAAEEGVSPTFIEGDHRSVSAGVGGSGQIDIAVCFDLFEHLFDDQLGALFCSLRESLARDGALIFHSYPTELDHLFIEDQCRGTPTLAHFAELKPEAFERLARAYASMFDAYLLMTTGRTHRQKRESWQHCNPLTARRLRAMLEHFGLDGYFVTLQTADDAPSKPHPGMVENAMAEAGVTPGETVVVGDTSFDMEMAINAGARAIGVGWGYHEADELYRAGALTVIDSFAALPGVIEGMDQ